MRHCWWCNIAGRAREGWAGRQQPEHHLERAGFVVLATGVPYVLHVHASRSSACWARCSQCRAYHQQQMAIADWQAGRQGAVFHDGGPASPGESAAELAVVSFLLRPPTCYKLPNHGIVPLASPSPPLAGSCPQLACSSLPASCQPSTRCLRTPAPASTRPSNLDTVAS